MDFIKKHSKWVMILLVGVVIGALVMGTCEAKAQTMPMPDTECNPTYDLSMAYGAMGAIPDNDATVFAGVGASLHDQNFKANHLAHYDCNGYVAGKVAVDLFDTVRFQVNAAVPVSDGGNLLVTAGFSIGIK